MDERAEVPLAVVVPGRYQPRKHFDQAALSELADSIRLHGIISAPLVFLNEKAELELIAGERRWRAAKLAGLEFIPVEVREYDLATVAAIAAVDNLQRDDLTPIDEGEYYNRLILELDVSEAALAKILGKNRAYIQQRRALASAPAKVREAYQAGAISFSQARGIAQGAPTDPKLQEHMLEEALKNPHLTEAGIKSQMAGITLKKSKKQLQELGWRIYSGLADYVWSEGERPRRWTSTEIAEAITAGKKPNPAPPDGAVSEADMETIRIQYRIAEFLGPWLVLGELYSGEAPIVVNAAEATKIAEDIRCGMKQLEQEVAALGWKMTRNGATSYLISRPGYEHIWAYSYSSLKKEVQNIRDGKAKKSVTPKKVEIRCDRCKNTLADGEGKYKSNNHLAEGGNLCNKCYSERDERDQRYAKMAVEATNAAFGSTLSALPRGMLLLLFCKFNRYMAEVSLRNASALDDKQLEEAVRDLIAQQLVRSLEADGIVFIETGIPLREK